MVIHVSVTHIIQNYFIIMNENQQYDIIKNAKILLLSTANSRIKAMQDSIAADILNLELSILHHNKIYDREQSHFIHKTFDELSHTIDSLVVSHKEEVFAFINNLMRDFVKSISPENLSNTHKHNDLAKDVGEKTA